jgi:ABC-type microcin C transport system permease subunit YejE
MDNIITGVVSAALFIAFVVGLANSIGAPPFMLITAIVSVMMVIDLVQSIRKEFAEKRRFQDD